MKYFWILLLTVGILECANAFASNTIAQQQQQLAKFNAQITQLQHTLTHTQDIRRTLSNELQHIDQEIGHIVNGLHQITLKMAQQQQLTDHLQQQSQQLQQQLTQQQQLLATQLQASYQLGKHEYLTLILNQQDPSNISRFLSYYRYINQARTATIANISHTGQQLEQNHLELKDKIAQLQKLQQQQQQQHLILEKKEHQLREVMQHLNQQVISAILKLQEVTANKHKLVALLQQLNQANPDVPQPHAPFAQMYHHLIWPTKGRVVNNFGRPIANSELSYSGITIIANQETPVLAIYPGKVVFADWLRGFGLLLIIDHGNRYMTLYAHNQSLYKKRGEYVKAGDIVAKIGHSGGFSQNGLYFEIRSNGKPLDPVKWLVKKA